MARLLKEDLRISITLDKYLAVEGRGLEDLVFRVGLATRNDYPLRSLFLKLVI